MSWFSQQLKVSDNGTRLLVVQLRKVVNKQRSSSFHLSVDVETNDLRRKFNCDWMIILNYCM
jgi:hypothetical protein